MFTDQKNVEALLRVIQNNPEGGGASIADRWRNVVTQVDMLLRSGLGEEELFSALAYEREDNEAVRFTMSWAKDRPKGVLVLSGDPGEGKTVAACLFAVVHNAMWCHAPSLCMAKYDECDARLKRYTDANRLVIDDLGAHGTTTPRAIDRMVTLIMARYSTRRQTVITTNMNPNELSAAYDGHGEASKSRLVDRLKHRGVWEELSRGSYRTTDRGVPLDLERTRYHDAKVCLRAIEHVDGSNDVDPRAIEVLTRTIRKWNKWSEEQLQLEVLREVKAGPRAVITPNIRAQIDQLLESIAGDGERGSSRMNSQDRGPRPEDVSQEPAVKAEDVSQAPPAYSEDYVPTEDASVPYEGDEPPSTEAEASPAE